MTLEEERKQRILAWEEKNGRKLKSLTREEWIQAARWIFALTEWEAEAYLDHLIAQNHDKVRGTYK